MQDGKLVENDSRKKTKLPLNVDWQALAREKQAEQAKAAKAAKASKG